MVSSNTGESFCHGKRSSSSTTRRIVRLKLRADAREVCGEGSRFNEKTIISKIKTEGVWCRFKRKAVDVAKINI